MSYWCTYKTHLGYTRQFEDPQPPTYSGIRFFTNELEAYRHANKHGLKVVEVLFGYDLDDLIAERL